MLEELHVRDLALIEDVWLRFGPGMTALTGETGAGKTVLLGALKLLMGERADSGAVRSGAREAIVEGRFVVGDQESIAARRVGADGRSRCTLDSEMATVSALGQSIGPLIDLHGQHEHQALLSSSSHSRYLDRWIGGPAAAARERYVAAWQAHRDAVSARVAHAARVAEAQRQADYLRFVVDEISRVAPVAGEDDALRDRLPALRHAEKLRDAADAAHVALHADGGAEDAAARALGAIERASGLDPAFDELAGTVAEAAALLEDASARIRLYRDGIEHDPRVLDEVESRLAALAGIERKYGPTLERVCQTLMEAEESLAALDAGTDRMRTLEAEVDAAQGLLRSAGDALIEVRTQAGAGFAEAVAAAMQDLAMAGTGLQVAFAEMPFDQWSAEGPHRVEFLFVPAAGARPRPLTRIASGGEVSRVMLALKGVLGAADDVPVLVFDEIDAGIGGATALAVGRRLSELAHTHQVIVVTHLAQVAAFADAQLVVEKEVGGDGRSVTRVREVVNDERVAEIARMLAGSDSATSLEHARELIEAASARR